MSLEEPGCGVFVNVKSCFVITIIYSIQIEFFNKIFFDLNLTVVGIVHPICKSDVNVLICSLPFSRFEINRHLWLPLLTGRTGFHRPVWKPLVLILISPTSPRRLRTIPVHIPIRLSTDPSALHELIPTYQQFQTYYRAFPTTWYHPRVRFTMTTYCSHNHVACSNSYLYCCPIHEFYCAAMNIQQIYTMQP